MGCMCVMVSMGIQIFLSVDPWIIRQFISVNIPIFINIHINIPINIPINNPINIPINIPITIPIHINIHIPSLSPHHSPHYSTGYSTAICAYTTGSVRYFGKSKHTSTENSASHSATTGSPSSFSVTHPQYDSTPTPASHRRYSSPTRRHTQLHHHVPVVRPQRQTLQIRVQLAQRVLPLQRTPEGKQFHASATLLTQRRLLRQVHVLPRRHHQLRKESRFRPTSTHTPFSAQATPSSV